MNSSREASPILVHSMLRLVHLIVDGLIWLALYLSIAYLSDMYLVSFSSYTVNYVYSSSLGLILFITYYSTLEYFFGRTLGKFLTGAKVVTINGQEITFKMALIRSLSRLIPVDPFYFLFSKNGLHDRLSRTIVIKKSKRTT